MIFLVQGMGFQLEIQNLIFFYKIIQVELSAWYTKEKKWTDSKYFLQLCFVHRFDNNID